ncbi:unnamed protein product [Symbiodinium necroappetens]|uniref:Uncharacterized protein n=1 Tax=Symbiodinium necroappetens TaxID=1628268 RepID=A0A812SYH7_9DINO|nr:unnamed protein product [Symbiodinium necroappetens]
MASLGGKEAFGVSPGFPREALAGVSPWPAARRFRAFQAVLDGGGREMVTQLLDMYPDEQLVLLEIGGFLGGSMRRWLQHAPNLMAVLLERDYFGQSGKELADTVQSLSLQNRELGGVLGCCEEALDSLENMRQLDGGAHTLFSNLWDFRERLVINFKGFPLGLLEVHRLGLIPDLVYIDTDKYMDELWVAHALWPGALLAGDDWTWEKARAVVMRFVRKFNYTLRVSAETWVVFAPSTARPRWRTPPIRPRGVAQKHWDLPWLNV